MQYLKRNMFVVCPEPRMVDWGQDCNLWEAATGLGQPVRDLNWQFYVKLFFSTNCFLAPQEPKCM